MDLLHVHVPDASSTDAAAARGAQKCTSWTVSAPRSSPVLRSAPRFFGTRSCFKFTTRMPHRPPSRRPALRTVFHGPSPRDAQNSFSWTVSAPDSSSPVVRSATRSFGARSARKLSNTVALVRCVRELSGLGVDAHRHDPLGRLDLSLPHAAERLLHVRDPHRQRGAGARLALRPRGRNSSNPIHAVATRSGAEPGEPGIVLVVGGARLAGDVVALQHPRLAAGAAANDIAHQGVHQPGVAGIDGRGALDARTRIAQHRR